MEEGRTSTGLSRRFEHLWRFQGRIVPVLRGLCFCLHCRCRADEAPLPSVQSAPADDRQEEEGEKEVKHASGTDSNGSTGSVTEPHATLAHQP